MMINFLLWIGFVSRTYEANISWPFHRPPNHVFRSWNSFRGWCSFTGPFYVFRNLPGVVKWIPGRMLPMRWGFGIFGFEFGDRGSAAFVRNTEGNVCGLKTN